jgi:Na+-driven multidrug efflux pump
VQGATDNDAIGEVAQEFDTKWKIEWIKRIIAYGLPALSIPMADPLMTTIDTIFVGQVRLPRHVMQTGYGCVMIWPCALNL